jgi:hypothetical protein
LRTNFAEDDPLQDGVAAEVANAENINTVEAKKVLLNPIDRLQTSLSAEKLHMPWRLQDCISVPNCMLGFQSALSW